jgi:uncharacterized damage-inducible protein DinB
MKDKTYLRSLLEFNAWANAEMYEKVRALPPEEVKKQRKTGLQSIHVSLNHLLAIDHIWLAHMQGQTHDIETLRTELHEDFDSLWVARQAMEQTLVDYLDSLSEDELEEIVDYTLIGGKTGSLSRAMCFTHLAIHGSYHRGWISDMFGQADAQPALLDIPVYERALKERGLPPLP